MNSTSMSSTSTRSVYILYAVYKQDICTAYKTDIFCIYLKSCLGTVPQSVYILCTISKQDTLCIFMYISHILSTDPTPNVFHIQCINRTHPVCVLVWWHILCTVYKQDTLLGFYLQWCSRTEEKTRSASWEKKELGSLTFLLRNTSIRKKRMGKNQCNPNEPRCNASHVTVSAW